MHQNQRTHVIENREGERVQVTSLKDFAAENNISIYWLSRLVNGHIEDAKGFKYIATLSSVKRKVKPGPFYQVGKVVLTEKQKYFNDVLMAI